jgi:hypothetical protein
MDKGIPTSVGGLDAFQVASLLIHHHGDRALVVATTRATILVEAGDRAGALEWLRISQIVTAMRKNRTK